MHGGYVAILMVITISLLLLALLVEVGDSIWRQDENVLLLYYRTEGQLAAAECRQLALLYLSENPDYMPGSDGDTFPPWSSGGSAAPGIPCQVVSVVHAQNNPSPYANRIIKTIGFDHGSTSTLYSSVEITESGIVPVSYYYQ